MKTITKWLFVLLLVAFYGCDDIIEEDITDDMLIPAYPLNNAQIESNVVNFQWQDLSGADDYRIQVYSSNQNMILDSLVRTNNFTFAILPGSYQWRVRGENFAYQTSYTFPLSFSVIETDDLTNQQVQLLYPGSGIFTQEATFTYTWSEVASAQEYVFQLINVSGGNTLLHQQNNITATLYSPPTGLIADDGQYMWKVKAINTENDTETQFASRNFYVDNTPPNQPLNTLPENETEENISTSIDFEWNPAQDQGPVSSSLTYIIQIATDTSFNSVIHTATTSNTAYQYTFTSENTYYWRVKAVDQSGNQGNYGGYFKIKINE